LGYSSPSAFSFHLQRYNFSLFTIHYSLLKVDLCQCKRLRIHNNDFKQKKE